MLSETFWRLIKRRVSSTSDRLDWDTTPESTAPVITFDYVSISFYRQPIHRRPQLHFMGTSD